MDRAVNTVLSNNRSFKIGKIEGKHTLADDGSIANRMFTGENKLHAIQDPTGLWALHYDAGLVPEPLRQQFTTFSQLEKAVKQYFHKRNLEIKEVIA